MDLRRISAPLGREDKLSVVGVDEVMAQARISSDDENDLIAAYIEAAYDYLSGPEGWLGHLSILPEQWEFNAPDLAADGFDLPMRPLLYAPGRSVTFEVWDGAAYGPVDVATYFVGYAEGFAPVTRVGTASWPYVGLPYARAYRLSFWAGYPDAASVPSGIRMAIKLLAAHWFNSREAVTPEGKTAGQDIPYGVKALAGRYRMALDHS